MIDKLADHVVYHNPRGKLIHPDDCAERYHDESHTFLSSDFVPAPPQLSTMADDLGNRMGGVVLGVDQSTKQRPRDELFIYEHGDGDEEVVLLHGLAETYQYWYE